MRRRGLLLLLAALAAPACARAGEVRVAVAANFAEPAREIARRFEQRTGHRATLSFGSSGQFYAQIANGAPFDVFLSADAERPRRLEAAGLAAPGSRFTYAVGRLVLWSRDPGRVDAEGRVLSRGGFEKLAIADSTAAPYGRAAMETLRALGLHERVRGRIVQGASITQAYQFVRTGAAELGFVALSQVVSEKGGSRWLVPARLHAPIDQQAVLLRAAARKPAARAFADFLKSDEARAVVRTYGYEVP
ncbi:molybdenum ABC transporter Molybdate-binding protein [Phenylobacterium zucineum HLK1]|uniref:Molybdenum ABC transporter Molybdate-binding protein n=1 Tax=Phenylobacterium zucineum (strain HLK1) TaxID=450851 RepID=B4RFC6_PHEZH|nr:molybdate ABC transporter substrate-binding protein [Phenylobacterium zucineum]ACG78696.1 molybdenum ABC transporter Molybdate-binding protein [Phenylobacterium zucineum HLK1]